MKILIINTIYYQINGIANVIKSHVEAIGKRNGVELYVTEWGEVSSVYSKCFAENNVRELRISSRRAGLFRYLTQLRSILKEGRFDCVHIHGNSGTMLLEARLAKKCGVPKVIVHLHNSSCSHPFLFGPNSILTSLMKVYSDSLIACSNKAGNWLFKKDFSVILNSFDVEKFKYSYDKCLSIRDSLNIPRTDLVLGNVGLLNDQKNQSFLLDVFKEVLLLRPQSYLVLVGGGPNEKMLRKKAFDLGIESKVVFVGLVDEPETYYNCMDVFVFPTKFEGLGMVIVEAQANGLPVVVSDMAPSEVKCCDLIEFSSLSNSAREWAELALKMASKKNSSRSTGYKNVINAGYDYQTLRKSLEELYCLEERDDVNV